MLIIKCEHRDNPYKIIYEEVQGESIGRIL